MSNTTELSRPLPGGYPAPSSIPDDEFETVYQSFQDDANRRFNLSEAPRNITSSARSYVYALQQTDTPIDLAPLHAAVDAALPEETP